MRELAHFAERFALGLVEPGPAEAGVAPGTGTLPDRVEAFEAALIRETLAAHQGDVRARVEALGIPRKTLYDRLRRHGIDQGAYRAGHRGRLTPARPMR